MVTAVKKPEREIYTQVTPRPNRKILLFDDNRGKHLFPLVRDRDVGIDGKYQTIVIQSVHIPFRQHNDDDKQTSSTQLHRGMMQTL
jgi:hypothetical protein